MDDTIQLIYDESGGGKYEELTPNGIEVSKTKVLDPEPVKRGRGRPKKDKTAEVLYNFAFLVGFRDPIPEKIIKQIIDIMSKQGWNPSSVGSYATVDGLQVPDEPTTRKFVADVMQSIYLSNGNMSEASVRCGQPYKTISDIFELDWFAGYLGCINNINIDTIVASVKSIANNRKEDSKVRLAAYKLLIQCHESKNKRLEKEIGLTPTISIVEYLNDKAQAI